MLSATSTCWFATAMRALSDSTSACAASSSDLLMTCSLTSCSRRPSVSSASRSRASSSAAPRRGGFELRLANGERGAHLRVVEPREHLPLADRLAFLDEDLEHLAGDLRRNRRAPAGGDVPDALRTAPGSRAAAGLAP